MKKRNLANRILWYEGIAFLLVIVSVWFCEFVFPWARRPDVGILVSIVVFIFAIPLMLLTRRVISRSEVHDEVFVSCAWCKKMKTDSRWVPVEDFFRDKFHSYTSHGICEPCRINAENEVAKKKPPA